MLAALPLGTAGHGPRCCCAAAGASKLQLGVSVERPILCLYCKIVVSYLRRVQVFSFVVVKRPHNLSEGPLISKMAVRYLVAAACLVASASAFCYSPAQCVSSSFVAKAGISQPKMGLPLGKSIRSPMVSSLRMQTEDEKAKASGIAFAVVGLVASKFSLLVAVLLGGGAVYAGTDPSCCLLHGMNI